MRFSAMSAGVILPAVVPVQIGLFGNGLDAYWPQFHGLKERLEGKLALLCAEAESVPGPILEIGNTNSRDRFSCGARAFVNRWNCHGPAHHCAVGVGHITAQLEKLGSLLGLEVVRVC